ncbi:Gfo/Idh/MocA family oxidoreductase [Tundrisphaera lichenicola]|uniref:Gfo/Idh/MocA family oxidoreductase n=1 Tax=Tundrisphaera lichenicola TaxID=2029860 RepID=UPI003EC103E2
MTEKKTVSRRDFMQTTGAATGALVTAGAFAHPAIGSIKGANERINFAVLGAGGRATSAHVRHLTDMKAEGKAVDIIGICDVWDGSKDVKDVRIKVSGNWVTVGRGLYPVAEFCGLKTDDKLVTKDYRKILASKDVDAVVIGTPDHWHAKMAIEAMESGKDVYCEKPMCHTIDEAKQITDTQAKTKQIFTVGVQSTAHPIWKMANDAITSGKIGHVMQVQTSYYRNSDVGQWRYYPLLESMNPKTVDWKMFLGTEFGLAPDQPFNRAKYAQWRCYWDFGGGMYTDLFVHQLTHMLQATGIRFPRRVVGGGGLYLEYDGRDVPDVATVVADYDEGCQVIVTATMANNTPLPEVIRGHTGTIAFENGDSYRLTPQELASKPAPPSFKKGDSGPLVTTPFNAGGDADTRALWDHFIECLRSRNTETLCPAETGYAAIATVNLGVDSYRQGKAYFFDKETGKVSEADDSWAKKWEKVSHERGKPNQVMGWKADPLEGSVLVPPAYQKLEGDWVDGQDPAKKA